MPDIKILKHSRELFCLIGEFFASAEIRKEFGEPMTSDESYTWFVAADEDKVAGFAAARINAKNTGELNYCWVEPEYRGRGLGSLLLQSRLDYLAQQGVDKIESVLVPDSVSKYLDLGFEIVSQRGRYTKVRKLCKNGI